MIKMRVSNRSRNSMGERTYKYDMFCAGAWANGYGGMNVSLQIDKLMLYPNGYLNMNQAGEYTKHYYADALRIASKIGGNYDNNFCDSVAQIETDYPEYITHRKNEQEFAMKNELDSVTKYNIITSTLLFDAPNECLLHGGFEEEVFYYHPDHLGSTGMVTNKYANITQALLYAPFGEIVNEYNPGWSSNRVPKYSFNAKELDEENGMYYYSARYYAPPTFISRDPLLDSFPNWTPYHYCFNNPIRYVDPTGMGPDDPSLKMEFYMEIKVSFGPQIGGQIKIFDVGLDLKAQGPSVEGTTRFSLLYNHKNDKWYIGATQDSKNKNYDVSAGIGNIIGVEQLEQFGITEHPVFKETITTLRRGVSQEITQRSEEGGKITKEKPVVLESTFSIHPFILGIEVTVGFQGYEE